LIYVTVGTDQHPFDRLLRAVDELLAAGRITGPAMAQIGYSTYEPQNMEWFRFADYGKVVSYHRDAKIIICHGGVGSILLALQHGKRPVVVPRQAKFGEHINDHQVRLAARLHELSKVVAVSDMNLLPDAINSARNSRMRIYTSNLATHLVSKYLEKARDSI